MANNKKEDYSFLKDWFCDDIYYGFLAEEAKKKDIFYARPVPTLPKNPYDPWYCAVPYGKNKLSSMFNEMCIKAGIGHKTNHSLRATGASELFKAGVPEKIIKERTGHRSLEALRIYERSSTEQHKAVSVILSSSEKTSFKDVMSDRKGASTPSTSAQASNVFNNCNVQIFQGPTSFLSQPQPTQSLPDLSVDELEQFFNF